MDESTQETTRPYEPVYQEEAEENVVLETDGEGRSYERTPEGLSVMFNGKEIGQLKLGVNPENKRAAIFDIGVNPEHQRKGIGFKLVELAERQAKEEGATRIEALAEPTKMLPLLKRAGYQTAGFHAWKDFPQPAPVRR